MRVFLNPGHAPSGNPDPGACGFGLRECDVAKNVTDLVAGYLAAAGVEVVGNLQSDSLHEVVSASNNSDTDVFISIHCNAYNGSANGTEVWYFYGSGAGETLANCIQNQIVTSLGTTDRGTKGAKPGVNGLYVLSNTDAVAVLVELAFIDHEGDVQLLSTRQDEFARAIARGVTDYEGEC
ncbi:N-acetylmuramoyl-L-alanine amidase family protein [Selenomonas felix]|uniref:N-acetylmuramoyl-L-alanine amidase family protein n=1 Tax=Selenomonas felix TaxID=1944634 RepID=UPI00235288DF|nr:N-acetylmuramoyl-L-alanine amidase [Selenomonas felix]